MAGKKKGGHGKRDRKSDDTEPRAKKAKVQPLVSIGNGSNLNKGGHGKRDRKSDDTEPRAKKAKVRPFWHAQQLASLSTLITKGKLETKITDEKSMVLEDLGCSCGLYMEWEKMSDSYYLWASHRSKALKIKFELLAALGDFTTTSKLMIKKPLLAFSQGFDDGNEWADVKSTLYELFDTSDASAEIEHDHIYAFTRTGGKFQIRIFKIQSMPTQDDRSLKLDEVLPVFVIKPVLIERPDTTDVFVDTNLLYITQKSEVCLTYSGGYSDAHPTTVLHSVDHALMDSLRLSGPRDLSQWEGCNTNLTEYFERYHGFKKTKVPGTGLQDVDKSPLFTPEVVYSHICMPFKMFGRSMILRAKERFAENVCFEKIDMSNIFFCGNTVRILNVKLVKYTYQKAGENLRTIVSLITRKLVELGLPKADFPPDLKRALHLMTIENLEIAANNVAWMDETKKISMVDELFQEVLTHMTPLQQLDVGRNFPSLNQLNKRIDRNWLLFDCRTFGIHDSIKSNPGKLRQHFMYQRNSLLSWVDGDKNMANRLNVILQWFRTPRNAFHHLSEAARRLGLGELTRKQIGLVLSSGFSDIYAEIQEGVPRAFGRLAMDFERANLSRFGKYFSADKSVVFDEEDKK